MQSVPIIVFVFVQGASLYCLLRLVPVGTSCTLWWSALVLTPLSQRRQKMWKKEAKIKGEKQLCLFGVLGFIIWSFKAKCFNTLSAACVWQISFYSRSFYYLSIGKVGNGSEGSVEIYRGKTPFCLYLSVSACPGRVREGKKFGEKVSGNLSACWKQTEGRLLGWYAELHI